jgi:hypothetical protein
LLNVADVIMGALTDLFHWLQAAIEASPGQLKSASIQATLTGIHHLMHRMVGWLDGDWVPIGSWGSTTVPRSVLSPVAVGLLTKLSVPDLAANQWTNRAFCLALPRVVADISKETVPWQQVPVLHRAPASASVPQACVTSASQATPLGPYTQPEADTGSLAGPEPFVPGRARRDPVGAQALAPTGVNHPWQSDAWTSSQSWALDSDDSEALACGDEEDLRDSARRRHRSWRLHGEKRVGVVRFPTYHVSWVVSWPTPQAASLLSDLLCFAFIAFPRETHT